MNLCSAFGLEVVTVYSLAKVYSSVAFHIFNLLVAASYQKVFSSGLEGSTKCITFKESNGVPDSVWDIADGKSSIFVVKPNKALSSVDSHFYYANDIWILESDMILNGK